MFEEDVWLWRETRWGFAHEKGIIIGDYGRCLKGKTKPLMCYDVLFCAYWRG